MSKPIVVTTTRQTAGYPKGAELGFETEAKATSILGEGAFKILRHQDGSEFVPAKPVKVESRKDEKPS